MFTMSKRFFVDIFSEAGYNWIACDHEHDRFLLFLGEG